jgi:hypothetical protein
MTRFTKRPRLKRAAGIVLLLIISGVVWTTAALFLMSFAQPLSQLPL